ncbi:unnamed protein product [Orchesella dallaii]|uniref:F-box domain-containing protein n=1 Tax=Orchesella dallaii TaxID=48710 RepID=A0ABP1QFX6_9HEXA
MASHEDFDETSSPVPNGSLHQPMIPLISQPSHEMNDWLQLFTGWSHHQRILALNELVGICNTPQLQHTMQIIKPRFQRDFISLLPKELALYTLSFLNPRDLLSAAKTCKQWRILSEDNLLWREKCKEAGVGYFSAMSKRVRHRSRNCNSAHSSTDANPDVANTEWKAEFLKYHFVGINWARKNIENPSILKGHDDHIITCLLFSENRIVSGSDDNTLKVWCATTGKCLRTLVGHIGGVWSAQMSGNTILSGSTDRTLRAWDADSGQCLYTLFGHQSTVRCMRLHGNKVVSGSRDSTLRVWDVEIGICLKVLVGHTAPVRCVQYNGHVVVSGSYDNMIRIWDPESEMCLHQLSGHTNRIYALQFDGTHVVSSSLDSSMKVWNVETGACKHTLTGHRSLTSVLKIQDDLLVSGNADSTVKIWNLSTGELILSLSGRNSHRGAVTGVQLANKFVITSSDDGTVKLWNIRTGEFIRNLVSLSSRGRGGVIWRTCASETKLVCAVGSRNGTEETKLLVFDFDTTYIGSESGDDNVLRNDEQNN